VTPRAPLDPIEGRAGIWGFPALLFQALRCQRLKARETAFSAFLIVAASGIAAPRLNPSEELRSTGSLRKRVAPLAALSGGCFCACRNNWFGVGSAGRPRLRVLWLRLRLCVPPVGAHMSHRSLAAAGR
jgi:hypothetical protein